MHTYMRIVVGQADADIVGHDQRALQAAIDYVAGFGQGTVEIGPGVYTMWDSLHLRSGVRLWGAGNSTVLRKCDGFSSPLLLDGDYGEEEITVADPTGFAVGHGVTILDDVAGGFHVTVTKIASGNGNTLAIAHPLLSDYLISQQAVAHRQFPVISGYYVHDCVVGNLTIDGNNASNVLLTGCRGAGIFLYRSPGTQIRQCAIHAYGGDGISFQQSNDVIVEDCLCEGNAQVGLHPGSGSQRPVIRRCVSRNNGQIGLFLCWRVRHGVFEDNVLEQNASVGISIGHKDTDNLFRGNVVADNGLWGIHFRDESEPMAGHRNRFINNRIVDNGQLSAGGGIRVDGATHDLEFERNWVGNAINPPRQRVGISIGARARRIVLRRNRFVGHVQDDYESEMEDSLCLIED